MDAHIRRQRIRHTLAAAVYTVEPSKITGQSRELVIQLVDVCDNHAPHDIPSIKQTEGSQ